MKRLSSTAIVALLLLFLVGCAQSPGARWAQAAQAVTATNNTITDLNALGVIDDEALIAVGPAVTTMNDALERAHARLPEGGTTFDYVMDALDAAIASLQQWLVEQQGGGGPE